MGSLRRFLTTRLTRTVNQQKSAVARPGARTFLGFSCTAGREPKRRLAPQVIERFKKRVRTLTSRTRGVSMDRRANELAQ